MALQACHDKLITALKPDPLTIAGLLFRTGFIPSEIYDNMLVPSFTQCKKATILVNAVREKIEIAPKRFHELNRVLSEQVWTRDIVEMLQSAYQGNESTNVPNPQCSGISELVRG